MNNIALLILASVIGLSLAEASLYLLEKIKIHKLSQQHGFENYKKLYRASSDIESSYEHLPHVDLVLKSGTNTMHIITNGEGLREEREILFEKGERCKRIIGLGDSIVEGAGVNNDETFLRVMERRLSTSACRVETLNFGIGSSNTRLEYHYLKYKKAEKYRPDIILLGFCLNDFDTRYRAFNPEIGNWFYPDEPDQPEGGSLRWRAKHFLLNFRTVQLMRAARDSWLTRKNQEGAKPDWIISESEKEAMQKWVSRLKEYSLQCGARFLVVVFPYRSQLEYSLRTEDINYQPQATIKGICDHLDIPNYDLFPDMLAWLKNNSVNVGAFYWDEIHPQKNGHVVVGELVSDWIAKNGWLARNCAEESHARLKDNFFCDSRKTLNVCHTHAKILSFPLGRF